MSYIIAEIWAKTGKDDFGNEKSLNKNKNNLRCGQQDNGIFR